MMLVSLTLPSCLDDDEGYSLGKMWIAVATVVPENERVYYLRLDGGDTLWPAATDYPNYEPKMNQRALVNFTILADSVQSNLGGFSYYVKVNAIHDILTKPIAPNLGAENDSIYGTDPVSILADDIWVGDGFLNIYFTAQWGGREAHFLNLIQPDPANPYTLEFRHNAYDDPQVTSGSGRVAFNLGSLPDTKGETVDLTIYYEDPQAGRTSRTVKYNSDKRMLSRPMSGDTNNDMSNITDLK